ncbi:MAG: hypothetical protein ACTSVC_11405 [Promethearchaeota archaeon]
MVIEESSKIGKIVPSEKEVVDEMISDGWIKRMTADQISKLPKEVIENLTSEQIKAIPLKKILLKLDELNEEELKELNEEDLARIEHLLDKLKKIKKN